jgi:hypothetical protein
MFRMTDLAVGALPAAAGPCSNITRCHAPSVPCHLTGPVMQACYHHSIGCHGPYSGPVVEAGLQTYACPYPGAHGSDYPAAGQPPPMQDGLYGQPPPMQAGLYGQPPPMQDGLYGQPPPMQAGLYGQSPPMQDGLYGQPPPMQDGLYGQPPPMQAGLYGQPPPMQAGPYGQPPPIQAGPYGQPPPIQAGPYGQPPPIQAGPYGQPPPMHQWAPQGMMPEMFRPGIPPYCQSPTNFCPGYHSRYFPCAWSCRVSVFYDQAMPGGMDPAAQLGALREQLLAQLAAAGGQQRGIGQGMAPTTIAETDRLIQELEATVHQLRAHRAALERLAGG